MSHNQNFDRVPQPAPPADEPMVPVALLDLRSLAYRMGWWFGSILGDSGVSESHRVSVRESFLRGLYGHPPPWEKETAR